MAQDVMYTTRWVDTTRKPAPRHSWLSADEARERWDGGYDRYGIVSVVDAATRDADGTPRPRWAVFGSATSAIRVRFFTPGGSNWRTTDYDVIDGRLWRWICWTYVYPDQDTRYRLTQATRVIKEEFLPDRTGSVQFDERDGLLHKATFTDAPVDGFWLERPAFGDWTDLANPDYGVPTGTDWPTPA